MPAQTERRPAAVEPMFQGRGKLRVRHHGSAESAEQKETREDTEAELVERSRGESDRHHRKDAKKGRPHEISGRGPGEARDETSREQENCITRGQASYSADPRIDSACTRKRQKIRRREAEEVLHAMLTLLDPAAGPAR